MRLLARPYAGLLLMVPWLSLTACGRRESADDTAGGTAGGATAVVGAETAVVTRQAFTETVSAIGTAIARPGHVAALAAPAPTRVARIFVAVGQRVATDSPLVAFDQAPFDAQARSAEVALTAAEHAQARAQRLADAGILARKEVDQASADLAQAQAAALTAHRAQSLATLRAPFSGVVTRLDAVLGGSVNVTQTLVEVVDPSALDLVFTVAQSEAARMRSGAPVHVTAGQGEAAEVLGDGAVAAVAAAIDTASRGVLVRVRLDHPSRPLRIGETVLGQITVAVHPNAVSVPLAALVPGDDGMKVFVVDSAHRAHATAVTVGARSEQRAEITSGLRGGETIVTVGAYGVDDSATVVPARTGPPRAAAAGGGDKR